jgi:hypothetical protein
MNVAAVFWVIAPCSLVEVCDVSEVLAASITGAIAQKTAIFRYIECGFGALFIKISAIL